MYAVKFDNIYSSTMFKIVRRTMKAWVIKQHIRITRTPVFDFKQQLRETTLGYQSLTTMLYFTDSLLYIIFYLFIIFCEKKHQKQWKDKEVGPLKVKAYSAGWSILKVIEGKRLYHSRGD